MQEIKEDRMDNFRRKNHIEDKRNVEEIHLQL